MFPDLLFFVPFLLCVVVDLCLVGVVPYLGVAAVVDLGLFFLGFASSGGAFPCVIAVP